MKMRQGLHRRSLLTARTIPPPNTILRSYTGDSSYCQSIQLYHRRLQHSTIHRRKTVGLCCTSTGYDFLPKRGNSKMNRQQSCSSISIQDTKSDHRAASCFMPLCGLCICLSILRYSDFCFHLSFIVSAFLHSNFGHSEDVSTDSS